MTKNVVLIRDEVRSDVVRGTLTTPSAVYHILERPWSNNKRNESCIPAGVYTANFMARSASGKYKNVYHLQAVPGRSGILIHNGNLVAHSRGCLIIGSRRGELAGKPAVLNSKTALGSFVDEMGQESFTLTIIGNQIIEQVN